MIERACCTFEEGVVFHMNWMESEESDGSELSGCMEDSGR